MNIGMLKAVFDREMNYVSRLNFIMIAYLFFKDVGFHWWYLCLIPVFLVWVYLDIKHIMPKEIDYLHRKSAVIQKILSNTEIK